ncbi:MAG: chemotaxis-specific protein-glutamate methyltransferase CheB [Campylobacterales bacterium]|nr:chemotaxis-specific protein-glutamate methyltransferase CheB [Campylobacterales bacterium]
MGNKVLIVDDSALVRKELTSLLEGAGYEVETARNGQDGVDMAVATDYDAITMDINMPVMDGITAVKEIMGQNPTPILMVSSLTTEDAQITFDAMDLGAVAAVGKPGTMKIGGRDEKADILEGVEACLAVPRRRLKLGNIKRSGHQVESEAKNEGKKAESVVLIGSSTGGPGLIEEICSSLPEDYPHAVCVVQHMPDRFTENFAKRLNGEAKVPVHESQHNMELLAGHVYIAKGGEHMHFSKKVSGKIVIRHGEATGNRFFKPSVDEMFLSAAKVFPANKMFAVELTGIGDDGADGMVELKNMGVFTIAESENTASVYGMPKEAFLRGGTCEVLDFPVILDRIIKNR